MSAWDDDATVQSSEFYNPFEDEETQLTPSFAMMTVLEADAHDVLAEGRETGVFDRTEAQETHTWTPPEHQTYIWKPPVAEEPKTAQVYPSLGGQDSLAELVESLKQDMGQAELPPPIPGPPPSANALQAPLGQDFDGPPQTLITVAVGTKTDETPQKIEVQRGPWQRVLAVCERAWSKTCHAARSLYERSRLLLARPPVAE